MSADTPEKLLPRRLDPRKLAQQRVTLSGSIPAAELPRLREAVSAIQGVHANLSLKLGEQGERLMDGKVSADVDLVCQRCLEAMGTQVTSDFTLAAVWTEDDAKQLPAAYDPWIVGEGEADLYEIVEEELLLSVPVVVYHQQACVDSTLFSAGEASEDEAPEKPNPFQVLRQLKGNIKK